MNDVPMASPARAWLIALVLVLPMPMPLIAPVNFVEPAGARGGTPYYYTTQLVNFLQAKGEGAHQPRGVMLTMSGGSCATVGPLRLTEGGVHMYPVYFPDGTIDSFARLVDVMIAGKPDFLVIQDAVLVLSKEKDRTWSRYRWVRSHWVGQVYGLARELGASGIVPVDDGRWRCNSKQRPQSAWPQRARKLMPRVTPYSEEQHTKVLAFLRDFYSAGIPILVVSPPINEYTMDYRADMFQAASKLVHTEDPLANVSTNRQSGLTPAVSFSDPTHILKEENQPYRDWLNGEIVRVLRERQDR